ncbi:MAG: transglycosylase SLT domain-containing protein [Bacteroidales bacterium]|nr:transglycosylase SLT domain-containing protein [Bacteroidales bacterium]
MGNKHFIYIIFVLLIIPIFIFSKIPDNVVKNPKDTLNINVNFDDPVVRMLDSLSNLTFFCKNHLKDTLTNSYNDLFANINPEFSDSVYTERLKILNSKTPCNLVFNDLVKKYINVYANQKRKLTSRVLGLSKIYFPVFEEILDKYNVPLELKYLAIVESALNPVAVSPANAAGLWQFIKGTGKLYQLNNNYLTDDRFDIYKSTDAAARHLRDLYNEFHNWDLVLAAYNAGAGAVKRAIVRAGGSYDFYRIYPFLPKETRAYVPAFIAVNYIMNYADEHNIQTTDAVIEHTDIDTVMVSNPLSFKQIAEMFKITEEEISFLNPAYRKGIIPASANNKYVLRLPKDYISMFINNENNLYAFKSTTQNQLLLSQKQNLSQPYGVHTVKKGESLHKLAKKYNCSISQLQKWNKLKNHFIHPGQKLKISKDFTETSYNN